VKAALLKGPSRLQVEEIPQPVSGPEDVRARMKYCSICGSALHIYESPLTPPGSIMGREWAGEVVELGSGTTQWSVGDRVWLGVPKFLTAVIPLERIKGTFRTLPRPVDQEKILIGYSQGHHGPSLLIRLVLGK